MKKVPCISEALFFVWFRPLRRSLSPLLSVSATLTSEISLEVNPPLSSFPHSLPSSLNPLISLSPLCPPPSIRVYQSPSFVVFRFLSLSLVPAGLSWWRGQLGITCVFSLMPYVAESLQDVTVQLRPDGVVRRVKVRIKWGTEEEEERWMQVRKSRWSSVCVCVCWYCKYSPDRVEVCLPLWQLTGG